MASRLQAASQHVHAQGLGLTARDGSSLHAPLGYPASLAEGTRPACIWLKLRAAPRPYAPPKLTEGLPGIDEHRGLTGSPLVTTDDHIDVERIELDSATDAAGLVGGDEGRTGAEERVDNDIAAIGEIEESVLEQGGGLDCRMVLRPRRASEPSDEAPG